MTMYYEPEPTQLSHCMVCLAILWLIFIMVFIAGAPVLPWLAVFQGIPSLVFVLLPAAILTAIVMQGQPKLFAAVALLGVCLGASQIDLNLKAAASTLPPQAKQLALVNWHLGNYEPQSADRQWQQLAAQRADVYVLQWHDDSDQLPADAKRYFPSYHVAYQAPFLTLSAKTIRRSERAASGQYQISLLDSPNGPLTIFNVCMEPVRLPITAWTVDGLLKFKDAYNEREQAFENLRTEAEQLNHDYVITGNFNVPANMGPMVNFKRHFTDLADQDAQELFPFTVSRFGLRLWRYDFAFANKQSRFQVSHFLNDAKPELSQHSLQRMVLSWPNNHPPL